MASISDILSAIQQGVTAVNNLAAAVGSVFPQAALLSTSIPTAGTITYTSSQAVAFLSVTTSSGGNYKIPMFT